MRSIPAGVSALLIAAAVGCGDDDSGWTTSGGSTGQGSKPVWITIENAKGTTDSPSIFLYGRTENDATVTWINLANGASDTAWTRDRTGGSIHLPYTYYQWETAGFIPLVVGPNEIKITASRGGRTGTRSMTVTYSGKPPTPVLPPPPKLWSVAPLTGAAAGGTPVTLKGSGFTSGGTTVTIGGTAASVVVVVDSNTITAVTPGVLTGGPADVTVTNGDGRSATLTGGFIYAPQNGFGALSGSFGTGGVVSPSVRGKPSAILTDGMSLYIVGYEFGSRSKAWRIEKRDPSTGALVAGFGANGIVKSDPSHLWDAATAAVIEGSNLYVVGYDCIYTGQALYEEWRIEKRSLETGALVAGFGNGGVVTSDPSAGKDLPNAVVSDGSHLYILGTGSERWRVEKRDLVTGALEAAFGSGGVVTSVSGESNGGVIAAGHLYTVGVSAFQWRIEKRSLATGTLDPVFGAGGTIMTDPGEAYAAVSDGADLYIAGYSSHQWRIEKRDLSTGSLSPAFGIGGVMASGNGNADDVPRSALIQGPNLYVFGSIGSSSSDGQWRVDRRDILTGAGDVFTSNPSPQNDAAVAAVSDGIHLYVVGYDQVNAEPGMGDREWRIEKRAP